MKYWKPIVMGSAVVAVALLSYAWLDRREASVSADEPEAVAQEESFLARLTAPFKTEKITLPAGTRIHIRLQDAISTKENSSGDRFNAVLNRPLAMEGKVLAPVGSDVIGRITQVEESGRVKGRASMTLVLQEVIVDGEDFELSTRPLTLVAQGTKKRDAAAIAGGAAVGAGIGAITGGRKGAGVGAGIGAGSGTGYVLATKGAPVKFGPETRFTFTLSEPLELPVASASGAE